MTFDLFFACLVGLFITAIMWPAVYIFRQKGSKRLKFILSSWLITVTVNFMVPLVFAPFYLFSTKFAPQFIANGINTLNWLLHITEFVDEWTSIILVPLACVLTPILLFKGRSEYHLTN